MLIRPLKFSTDIGILLLFALTLRIILMVWSFQYRENPDILRYRDWARISYLYGIQDAYKTTHLSFGTIPSNMPPGSVYIVAGMYRLDLLTSKILLRITHSQPGKLEWMNGPLINGFLRTPNIVSDLLSGYLIYMLVKKFNKQKNALFASGLFLFNPTIFYNSSFWGQMDAINNMFFILGLYMYFNKKRFFSLLFLFLSLYVKLSLVYVILPLFFLFFLFEKEKKKFIIEITCVAFLMIFATLPISSEPHIWGYNFLLNNSLGEMKNITAFAYNMWWVIFKPTTHIGSPLNTFEFSSIQLTGSPLSSASYFGLSLFTWAILAILLCLAPFFKVFLRLKKDILKPSVLFLILSIFSFMSFMLLPHMHERYLFPFFPLCAIYYGLTNKFKYIYMFVSLLNLINLYLIWHPTPSPLIPYPIMIDSSFQWSVALLTTSLFFFAYLSSLKKLLYERT